MVVFNVYHGIFNSINKSVDPRTRKGNYVRVLAIIESKRNKPLSKGIGLIKYKDDPDHLKYYKECQAELALMKTHWFKGTLVNYYDFLTKSLNTRTSYVRNKDIMKELRTKRYKTIYPIYSDILEKNFDTAVDRQKSMEKVSTILSEILQFAHPEHLVFEIIFKCLSKNDIDLIIADPTKLSTSSDYCVLT